MQSLRSWIKAFRLRTLPLSVSGILFGSALALEHGKWNGLVFTLALSTTLFFQILSNLANDLGDGIKGTDNDQRLGPMRGVQSGDITPEQMRRAVVVFTVMSFVSAFLLIWVSASVLNHQQLWYYAFLALACVLAAIGYTLGKKAYGYLGLGDIMVYLFFGVVSVCGVYPLYGASFNWVLMLPASVVGLLSAAVLNLNNMRDRENDAYSGKNTLVVRIGGRLARYYHFALVLVALTLLFYQIAVYSKSALAWISAIPALILIIHLQRVSKVQNEKEYDPQLKVVALSVFAITLLYFIHVILTLKWH